MIVTDKKYHMEDKYKGKLDLMIKRMRGTDDNILIFDGDEGQGKTEMIMGTCYYVSYKTKRKYDIDNIFFDLDEIIKFASSTEGQILHYDEGALGLLTTNWQSKVQQKFNTLVMIARKKRHFICIAIPKFHRLSQYLIEERSVGLVHVYSRRNLQKGRFTYYTKKKKELLYTDWKRTKVKKYKDHMAFWGTFPIASTKIFTEEQNLAYDEKKDEAILKFGGEEKKESPQVQKWKTQRDKLLTFIKNRMGLKYTEMEKEFRKDGIDDIDMEMARRAVRRHRLTNSL